jgi:hypothetical protein
VSTSDGHDPDFDDLNLMAPESLLAEEPPAEPLAEPAATEGEPVKIEAGEAAESPPEAAGEPAAESVAKRRKLPFPSEWGIGVAIPVVLLVLVVLQVLYLSTAIFLICVALVGFGIWRDRETNTVYTVLLGCALVAILTALYCLWAEMGRYQFDVRAKQRTSLSAPAHADLPV